MGIFSCCFGERDQTPPPTRPNETDSLIKNGSHVGGTGYSAQSVMTVHPSEINTTTTPTNSPSKKKATVTPTKDNAKFQERRGTEASPTVSGDF